MKQFIKDYFTFNKAEKNGILVLVSLIVLLLLASFVIGKLDLVSDTARPKFGKEINDFTKTPEGTNVPWDTTQVKPKPQFPIDMNKADTTQLKYLTGVGSSLALRIVNYRDSIGGFQSIEQLLEIKGIGAKKVEGFREQVVINRLDLVNEN